MRFLGKSWPPDSGRTVHRRNMDTLSPGSHIPIFFSSQHERVPAKSEWLTISKGGGGGVSD